MKRLACVCAFAVALFAGAAFGAEPADLSVQDVLNPTTVATGWNTGTVAAGTTDVWLYPQRGKNPTETSRPTAVNRLRTATCVFYAPSAALDLHFYGASAAADTGAVALASGQSFTIGVAADSIRVDRTSSTALVYFWTLIQ
jgi:hypothetical protein